MAGRRDIFEQAMRQGHSAAWDQQWDRAIAAYRKAIEEFPEDTSALTSLGLAFFESNRLNEALQVYQRAAQLAPNEPLALEKSAEIMEHLGQAEAAAMQYLGAAEIYLRRREVPKAIENWEQVARLTPDQVAIQSRLALAYERTGQIQAAIAAYLTVARLFQKAGESAKALQAVQRAAQLDPHNEDASAALYQVKHGATLPDPPRRSRGVTAPLRMARAQSFLAPEASEAKGPAAEQEIGIVEAAQKNALAMLASLLFDDAERNDDGPARPTSGLDALTRGLTGAMRLGGTDRNKVILHLGQAIDQHMQGHLREAVDEYEHAVAAGLEHPAAHFNLGSLRWMEGDTELPAESLRAALQHPDYSLAAHLVYGQFCLQSDQVRDGLLHLLEALRQADLQVVPAEQADALSQRYEALADAIANEPSESDAELRSAAVSIARLLSGADWQTRLAQARSQMDSDDHGPPAPLAEVMMAAGTEHVVDAMARISRYLQQGHPNSAMEEAFLALESAPTYLPLHLRVAEILLQSNRLDAAITKYAVIAETYRARGDAAHAAKMLEQVVRLAPMNLEVRAKLVSLLRELGQTDQALSQSIDLADAYYQLADLDRARQTLTDALPMAQQSSGNRAWSAQILHQIGDIDVQRLDWRQALRVYEQIRTLAPTDEKARSTLVDLNLRLGQTRQAVNELDDYLRFLYSAGRLERAISLVEELVRTRPKEMAFRARLARLYQEAGRKAEAIAQFDALGELQLQAGLKADAANTIRTILSLGPEDSAGYQQLLIQLGG